ncbi:hypothetical protein F383_28726 [Gossypium arboreum]|uniref:Uncharacterized protein n=1 Tax=Gossypium arboreum TaxID=29729 RepID=A0A0B0MYY9_GOSAR|nr:hypothetical protein F383_28726 [Gossypium arboreum]
MRENRSVGASYKSYTGM